jgi:hypothetical protein
LLNILITLLCRIVRISWLTDARFKQVISEVLLNIKEENTFSSLIPFLIYSELIYQFQSDLPPKNKYTIIFFIHRLARVISDFKDISLIHIYEYASNFLMNIFKQNFKFEKIEHCLIYINEISKCITECMEFEDDLNVKEECYKKFEIKPVYVPNNKKRCKDKSLDIDGLILITTNLFDTHNIISNFSTKE